MYRYSKWTETIAKMVFNQPNMGVSNKQIANYNLNISLNERANVMNRAQVVGGICGTITAIQILNHFGIPLTDEEIKTGLKDSQKGTNQVNMALFMAKYLNVTFCVNYDIKIEIEKGTESLKISNSDIVEFSKLLNSDIHFAITPQLNEIINLLNSEDALAQFVFLEEGSSMTHYGLLCKTENNLMEFTQRENQTGRPDVRVEDFMKWWDLKGTSVMDPEQLVLIYRKKTAA